MAKTEADTLNIAWCKRYGSAAAGNPTLIGAHPVGGGGYRVHGISSNGTAPTNWPLLMQLDAAGDHVWSKLYAPTGVTNPLLAVSAGAPTAGGGFVQAGSIGSAPANSAEIFLLKTNASGDVEWSRGYRSNGFESIRDVRIAPNGNVVALANIGGASALIALNANGQPLWGRDYTGVGTASNGVGEMVSLSPSPNGGYVVAGKNAAGNGGLLFHTDAIGDVMWGKSYEISGKKCVFTAVRGISGGFVAFGHTFSANNQPEDFFLLKTDVDGNVLSAYTFGTNKAERAAALLAVSADEWVAVGGHDQFASKSYWAKTGTGISGLGCSPDTTFVTSANAPIIDQNPVLPNKLQSANVSFSATAFYLPSNAQSYAETLLCAVSDTEAPVWNNEVKIFPNPVQETATLSLQLEQPAGVALSLFSASGQMLRMGNFSLASGAHTLPVDCSGLPAGLYFLSLQLGRDVLTQKIIKL